MCTIVQKVQRFVYQPTSAFDQYKWNFPHVVTEKTSVCKNIPGISVIATSLPSYASMIDVNTTDSRATVGEVAYCFEV